jgi:hypothetical protein
MHVPGGPGVRKDSARCTDRDGHPAATPGERRRRQAPQIGPHADASRVQRNMGLLDFETPDASVILTVLLTLDVRPGFRYGQRACGQGPAGRSYEAWVTPQPC